MELLKEILIEILSKEKIHVEFNLSNDTVLKAVDSICFRTLYKIKQIIQNDALDDFNAIEEIVCLLDEMNIDFGFRHDFG